MLFDFFGSLDELEWVLLVLFFLWISL